MQFLETLFYNGLFQDEERKLLLIKPFVECKKNASVVLFFFILIDVFLRLDQVVRARRLDLLLHRNMVKWLDC